MASGGPAAGRRASGNTLAALLAVESKQVTEASSEETEIENEFEGLSLSQRIARSFVQRLKKKRNAGEGGSSSRCLTLYLKGGGCRVGSCEELEADCRRRSSAVEEDDCIPRKVLYGIEKRSLEKLKVTEPQPVVCTSGSMLPDDVLELILVRLPLTSLMAARRVCRKWRRMTTAPHFLQMRSESPYLSPWLFLFGVTREGCLAGEVEALDVSVDQWHRISHDMLKGRSLFSVASIGTDLYIVGGRTNFSDLSTQLERSSLKTHKGVLVFNPLAGLWGKAAPMNSARSAPVLGVFEVSSSCSIFQGQPRRKERIQLKSRVGAVSDVYEDPHRFSLRRQLRDASSESGNLHCSTRKSSKPARQGRISSSRFGLIAVGGRGPCDGALETGEIYDPVSNKWIEIASLPGDFGVVCSGAVCGGVFYVYSDIERLAGYDLDRGFWFAIQTSHPPPCLREYHPKIVSCRSRLFLVCVSWCERDGVLNRREKAVRKLWELDFMSHTWNEASRHPDAPMDCNASFVAGRDRIYGIEMFRIFGQMLEFLTSCHVSETELNWTRISRKHAAHEADGSSYMAKSMVVLHV